MNALSNIHPQKQQLLTLLLILMIAKVSANIYLSWADIGIILSSTVATEHLLIYLRKRKLDYISYSALSTSIGVIIMMVSTNLWLYIAVISMGIIQKNILKINDRHIFNPSNFAINLGLVLFYDQMHIVMGQLGDSLWFGITAVIVGYMMLLRINRWVIPLVFSLSYLLFEYLLIVSYDPVLLMDELYHRFYSVSFLLFVLFMTTDPATTPSRLPRQVLFGVSVALVSALLDRYYGFRAQHIFMALFAVSSLSPLYLLSTKRGIIKLSIVSAIMLSLSLGAIINIGKKAPYHYEMEG